MIFLLNILAWVIKNVALLAGIVEALAKLITGIITLTPTKRDDEWLPKVDEVCSKVKQSLYWLSEKFAGKE